MKKILITLSFILSLNISVMAQDKKNIELSDADKQEMINSEFQMPSAGALVNSLNKKLGDIDWNSFITPINIDRYKSQEDMALNLGLRGADAYFLIKSKDSANLIAISTGINYLLNKIVINKKSLNTSSRKAKLKKVKNLVKAKNWKKVLFEITKLQNNINNDLINAKASHLELLNNVGGWIEGYRLAVEGFNKNFKAEKTDILLQNELINYLLGKLKKNKKLKSYSKTVNLIETLESVNSILKGSKNYQLTKVQVQELLKVLLKTKQYI